MDKTTILPANNAAEAKRLFQEKLAGNTVLFVALGEGTGPTALLARAARLAGDANDPRWVIAAPRLADILATIQTLDSASPTFKDLVAGGTSAAFTTSVDRQIRDVIGSGETADDARVQQAYLAAE